jgi:hypothetical protein
MYLAAEGRTTNGRGHGFRLGLLSVACLACCDSLVCIQDARPFSRRLTLGLLGLVGAAYITWLVTASLVWYFEVGA